MKHLALAVLVCAVGSSVSAAQGLNPTELLKPPTQHWPTYNGDYSGRRYSTLSQINRGNVAALTLAWAFQTRLAASVKGTPLEVNGILYFSLPDNVWAADAQTGRQIWHYQRPSEGDHLAFRGLAMYKDHLIGTPDAHLVCLDARTGKEVWNKTIADVAFGYYLSVAPLIVKDLVIVGTSGDSADVPHFLEALNPETGEMVWRWSSIPEPGTPAAATWPGQEAMKHGGGPMWITGTYDPRLNLLYWGTGNPHPVLGGGGRSGENLYTCSIVALNPDNGKLVWYFQPSPHDTHDWDAVETPVLFDAPWHGRPRRLLAQASRNGYFFVLDRATGEHLLTARFVHTDWASGVDSEGRPIPDPKKDPQPAGAFVKSPAGGSTNWMAPSFDPDTNLFYVTSSEGSSMWYLMLDPDGKPEGHQGGATTNFWSELKLLAIDYRTGNIVWQRSGGEGHGNPGILTTAGGLLFTGDSLGNLLALDPASGKVLWHAYGGGIPSNSPMTYTLDGRQYVITGVDGVIYAWSLPDHTHQ